MNYYIMLFWGLDGRLYIIHFRFGLMHERYSLVCLKVQSCHSNISEDRTEIN